MAAFFSKRVNKDDQQSEIEEAQVFLSAIGEQIDQFKERISLLQSRLDSGQFNADCDTSWMRTLSEQITAQIITGLLSAKEKLEAVIKKPEWVTLGIEIETIELIDDFIGIFNRIKAYLGKKELLLQEAWRREKGWRELCEELKGYFARLQRSFMSRTFPLKKIETNLSYLNKEYRKAA